MDWNILSAEKAQDFIAAVRDDSLPGLFDSDLLRVQTYPLDFYRDGWLYVLENLTVAPPFSLFYLKGGDKIAYLDGSPAAFEKFNAEGLLVLNEKNAVEYLKIYCTYVIQRPNNILLLKNAEEMPFTGDYYVDFHFDKDNYSENDIKVSRNPDRKSFIIEAPFVFDGKIDPATAYISDTGAVDIRRREGLS